MSAASEIMASLGAALETAFADYEVIYGLPVYDGTFAGVGNQIRVHLAQETETLQSQNLLGGKSVVQPLLAVTLSQPVDSTDLPTSIERATAIWSIAADIRAAILTWILSTVQTPITDVGTVSFIDFTTTPALLDMGGNTGMESVTIQTTIRYTRNAGGA